MINVSYKTNDPKGWCGDSRRGAAMGRSSHHGDPDFEYKFVLRKVDLNSGGYDSNGTYFGGGKPLYWYASSNHEGTAKDGEVIEVQAVDAVLRANNRNDAKAMIREQYPNSRFFQ
jgi:hypothetical protein